MTHKSGQIQVISAERGLNIRGAHTPAPYMQKPTCGGGQPNGTVGSIAGHLVTLGSFMSTDPVEGIQVTREEV